MATDEKRLARNARITLEVACGLKAGETLVIIRGRPTRYCPEPERMELYVRALAQAAVALGALPLVADVREFMASPAFEADPGLAPLRAALEAADVAVNTMDQVGFTPFLGRRDNNDEFLTANRRWVFLQSNGMEKWEITADEVTAIRRRTRRVLDLLAGAKGVRVTSPAGTDFTFDMGPGSNATPILGIVPLYGEVAVAPRQGSEAGLIVVDGPTQMGVRTKDELAAEPLRIEVAGGRVQRYTGDAEQVARLKAFIASGDPPADAIDEVGILTTGIKENDIYWWSDGTHHHDTVHIALGNNLERQSRVHGARHMDGEVIRPTVSIDGQVVVEQGRFVES